MNITMAKRRKKKKKKWSKLFGVKMRKGVLRERYKEVKAFHMWRRVTTPIGNKKAKLNKSRCRIKIQSDE